MNPRGPLRQRKIEMKRPTTTGGSPIPVLIRLTTRLRPGKRASAIKVPSGIPTSSESPVARPDTWSESRVIPRISESPVAMSRTACVTPCQISSTLSSPSRLGLPRVGEEKGLAVLLDPERPDHVLRLPRDHEVGERLPAGGVHLRKACRVDLHHVVDVQERRVPFEEDRELDPLFECQVRGAVRQRVRALFRGDRERGAHSLTRLDVPRPLRRDPGGLPER